MLTCDNHFMIHVHQIMLYTLNLYFVYVSYFSVKQEWGEKSHKDPDLIPGLPLTSCVALGKLGTISGLMYSSGKGGSPGTSGQNKGFGCKGCLASSRSSTPPGGGGSPSMAALSIAQSAF